MTTPPQSPQRSRTLRAGGLPTAARSPENVGGSVGAAQPPETSSDGPGRRSGEPRGRRWWLSVAIGAVLLVGLGTWLVAFSPVLGARSVRVDGTRSLSAEQVRAAARITGGTPLVRLDTSQVARRVQALPEVASASVRTRYPNTVVITVTERTAVGYLELGHSFVLVDRTGAQYRTVTARPARLPLFAVPAGDPSTAVAAARSVAGVAAFLGPALLARVASIQAFDPTAITLLLTDHRVVRWGSVERSADKARVLPALLAQPGTQFDVTDPDQVVAR